MLARLDRRQRMAHAGDRMAGGLDDAVDALEAAQRAGIVGDMGGARVEGLAKRARTVARHVPADPVQRGPRLGDIEIGNAEHVVAGKAFRLGQDHRAELARADQADADGLARGVARGKHG